MKTSDVLMIVSVFFALFAVVVIAYGVGLCFDNVQIALVFGFGVVIFIVAIYFFKMGKHLRKNEDLEQLKKIRNDD